MRWLAMVVAAAVVVAGVAAVAAVVEAVEVDAAVGTSKVSDRCFSTESVLTKLIGFTGGNTDPIRNSRW
jgi:hypothetical protein